MDEFSQIQRLPDELARVSQAFEDKIWELSVLRHVWDSMKGSRDPRRVFEAAIDTFIEETSAENCSLMVLNREAGELTVKAARGQKDPGVGYYQIANGSRRSFRVGEGIAGWVAQNGKPISIPDVSQDSRFVPASQSIGPIRSLLCFPLLIDDEVVGVANLSHSQPHAFSSEEERLLAVVADRVAVALNSLQAFEEMRQLNAQLREEVQRVTESLHRAHDDLEKRVELRTAELSRANAVQREQIAKREVAEEALRETNRRLEEALSELRRTQQQVIQQERLRALGQMASGIAHDFNNALSPIVGFSELLLTSPEFLGDREKAKGYLKTIHTAAMDASNVVRRLREFYRRRDELEDFFPVRLDRLVAEAISLTQPKWKDQALANGVTISVETDLRAVPTVAGNEAELREVLTNLIFNAVDAMPGGGTITLRTRCDGGHALLALTDTGAGMTEEVRQRCLEPFFTTKGEQGTGMGLAMVHGIIQRHEGAIEVESEPGRGTTFTVRLPIQAGQRAEAGAQTAEAPLRALRILVVDDDPMGRTVIAALLASDGHTVEVAGDGREGLKKFEGGGFDLVITDRAMPEMSGGDLAAAIKRIAPNRPILMLTGFGDMMQAAGEKPKSVDIVLCKPITQARLRAVLSELTRTRQGGPPPAPVKPGVTPTLSVQSLPHGAA